MTSNQIGEAAALGTAVTWAFALVLFKRSGERIAPLALNLFKNTIGLVLLGATLIVATLTGWSSIAVLRDYPRHDLYVLLLSGFLGIALADTIFFYALNLIGVGLIAIVDCSYAPLTVLFAWLLLAEKLSLLHYVGGALIVVAVFSATRHDLPAQRTRGQILLGSLLAVLAIALMAFGIVLAKPALAGLPVIWSTTLRLAAGTLPLALFALVWPANWGHWRVFVPQASWRYAVPGSILGTYVCLILWIAGYKYTHASIAAVLNQSSVVFQALLAALVLKETFGPRKIVALALALAGVLIVTLNEPLRAAWLQIMN